MLGQDVQDEHRGARRCCRVDQQDRGAVTVAEIARYPGVPSAASANGTSSALDGDRSAVVAVVHPGVCASWVTRAETPPL